MVFLLNGSFPSCCKVLVPEGFGQDVCTKLSLRPSPPVSPPIRRKHPSHEEGRSLQQQQQQQESLQSTPPRRKRRNTEPPGEGEGKGGVSVIREGRGGVVRGGCDRGGVEVSVIGRRGVSMMGKGKGECDGEERS